MKKIAKSAILAAAACLSLSLMACSSGGDTITTTPNQGVAQGVPSSVSSYTDMAYYEVDEPSDVKLTIETDKIQKVSYKFRTLSDKEYTFKNGVLTVDKSVFNGESAGDKKLRVFVDNKYLEIVIRVVTKVIYTPDDFNSIRNNMNGTYVLGADIDFGNAPFNPIGKPADNKSDVALFEGILDGCGHSISNITINAMDWAAGDDGNGQGPSLGGQQGNGRNYSNGIFMSTGGSSQIINTAFYNITVKCYGLGGAVAGANGGIIKNCFVSCSLQHGADAYSEKAGGIVGSNGSGDAAGRIENCLVVYSSGGGDRGIADWNNGTIKNCYAAVADDYVLHLGYDKETGKVAEDFDYDEFITQDNFTVALGNFTMPAFPGSLSWGEGGKLLYYKGGDIINSDVVRKEYMLDPSNFKVEDGWDSSIWNFTYGAFPTLKVQSR